MMGEMMAIATTWGLTALSCGILAAVFHPVTKGPYVFLAFRVSLVGSELAPFIAATLSGAAYALWAYTDLTASLVGKGALVGLGGCILGFVRAFLAATAIRSRVESLPFATPVAHPMAEGAYLPPLLSWEVGAYAALPYPLVSSRVKVETNIPYATLDEVRNGHPAYKKYKYLDVYTPPPPTMAEREEEEEEEGQEGAGRGLAPVVVYVHGGGWHSGSKDIHGATLCGTLAERNCVCVSINYAVHSRPTLHEGLAFPEHLIDVKRALRWVKQNIAEYGGDPDFVVIVGGSAGGHLAAEAALTSVGHPELQPGFEDLDLSVQGFVSLYGVLDVSNRTGLQDKGFYLFVKYALMRVSRNEDPDIWDLASPYCQISHDSPPGFLIHGDADNLVDLDYSTTFADRYAEVTGRECPLLVVPGAVHAFDVFPSIRSYYTSIAIFRFLLTLHADHRDHLSATATTATTATPPRRSLHPDPRFSTPPRSPVSRTLHHHSPR